MEERPRLPTRGLIIGSLFIAYGLLGGVYDYIRDSNALDFFARGYAVQGAILHAVLFCGAGLAVMGWYYLKAREPFQDP